MRALVTGATGFVGAAVARALLAEGWQVRVLVRRGSDRRNIATLAAEQVVGDLTDAASLERAVAGCEAAFPCRRRLQAVGAAAAGALPDECRGTGHLLEAARAAGVRRIVYTSSVATVGLPAGAAPAPRMLPWASPT